MQSVEVRVFVLNDKKDLTVVQLTVYTVSQRQEKRQKTKTLKRRKKMKTNFELIKTKDYQGDKCYKINYVEYDTLFTIPEPYYRKKDALNALRACKAQAGSKPGITEQ